MGFAFSFEPNDGSKLVIVAGLWCSNCRNHQGSGKDLSDSIRRYKPSIWLVSRIGRIFTGRGWRADSRRALILHKLERSWTIMNIKASQFVGSKRRIVHNLARSCTILQVQIAKCVLHSLSPRMCRVVWRLLHISNRTLITCRHKCTGFSSALFHVPRS